MVRGDGSGLLYITDRWGFQVKVTIDKQDAPWMCSSGIAFTVMDEGWYGYEFYPVRNYDMNSDDWMWAPEEFESVFQEKGPFVQPLVSPEGIMTGYAYLLKPQISQELLMGVVQEIVQQGYISTDILRVTGIFRNS